MTPARLPKAPWRSPLGSGRPKRAPSILATSLSSKCSLATHAPRHAGSWSAWKSPSSSARSATSPRRGSSPRLAAAISDWTIATSLQGAADAAMERIGLALYPPDRELCDKLLAAAPSHIGAASFDSLIAAGRTLSLTEATAHARKILAIVADAGPPPPADA